MTGRTRRARQARLTAQALALGAAGWAALVGIALAFDADWPVGQQWVDFLLVCLLITTWGVVCYVVLAGSWRLDALSLSLVAVGTGYMAWWSLTLAALLFRGRLHFDRGSINALVAALAAGSVWLIAARLRQADPEDLPPRRTRALRVGLWLAALGALAAGVWGAGHWL